MGSRKANERNWFVWDHDPIESEANDPRHASRPGRRLHCFYLVALSVHEEERACCSAKKKIAQRALPQEFEDKIIAFQRMIIRMRQENNYDMQQIGNMDDTPMNFDMPPSRTVNSVGEKTIMIKTTGNEKTCFTVVLA